jgi:hypothetical protein
MSAANECAEDQNLEGQTTEENAAGAALSVQPTFGLAAFSNALQSESAFANLVRSNPRFAALLQDVMNRLVGGCNRRLVY